ELRKKALDAAGAAAFNDRLRQMWPDLRRELLAKTVPVERMRAALAAAGGPTTAAELGVDIGLWRDAVRHAHEIRNRWSFLDLAASAGIREDFVAEEV